MRPSVVATCAAAVAAIAAGGTAPRSLRAQFDAECGSIRVAPSLRFNDTCGRERYFRGVNVVVKSPPYLPSATVFNAGSSLTPADMAMWQSLGFSIVRLGVMWAGAQPTASSGSNHTYLSALANMSIALLADAGVYTLLDAHQDLFSEAFCADGAPAWLAETYPKAATFPSPLGPPSNVSVACGQYPWATYYFTSAVGAAFQALYTNASYTAAFGAFWHDVVTAFGAAGSAVHSYELYNEPWPGDVLSDPLLIIPGIADASNLQPMYAYLSNVIRSAETASGIVPKIIASESITFDDFFPVGFTAIPGTEDGLGALSYHYYAAPNLDVDWQVAARVADAARLRAGAILTEFDIDIGAPWEAYNETLLRHTLDAADASLQSWIGWAYSDMWFPNGTFNPAVAMELSRPCVLAAAGAVQSVQYTFAGDASPPVFNLTYAHNLNLTAPTVVYVNTALHFVKNFTVQLTASPPVPGLNYSVEWYDGAEAEVRSMQLADSAVGADPPPTYSFAYVYVTGGARTVASTNVEVIIQGL